MSNKHEGLWYVLDKLSEIADTYTILKNDEDRRDTNTHLGKLAIKYNILFLVFFGGATALSIWAIHMFKASSVLYGILLAFVALGLAITSIIFVIPAFASEISQMRLNKRPIGIIALLITLLIIIAAVVAIVIAVTVGI